MKTHPARVCFALLASAALWWSATSSAVALQAADGAPSHAFLRFVGLEEANRSIASTLTQNDLALLVAAAEPVALNDLIAQGIPVRSSRIQQLIDWGLLRQVNTRFQSLLPIVSPEREAAFLSLLDRVAPAIVDEVAVALQAVDDQVWRHPGIPTLPVLTAWLLRDQAWQQLIGPAGIDLNTYVREQQQHLPDRGFWGVLWYAESVPSFPIVLREDRYEEYTVQLAWNAGETADPFAGDAREARVTRFLDKLERDGRRLDDHREFPELLEMGLIEPERGDLLARASRYRLRDEGSLARIVAQAAADIATSLLSRLPRGALADALGNVPEELAMTLAYMHLTPRIVTELADRRMAVRPDMTSTAPPTESIEVPDEDRPNLRIVLEGEDDGAVLMLPGAAYSVMIWKDLPRGSTLDLPW